MKRIVTLFIIFPLIFLLCSFFGIEKKVSIPLDLIRTWYEAPELVSGDTISFIPTKHVLTPTDNPAFEFGKITFQNSGDLNVEYWRWCANSNWMYNGVWTNPMVGIIKLDFGTGKCKNQLKIISLTPTLLKVIITEE